MSNDKKNIIYSAADIEKYFGGKLSPAQMHEMEKASLDDAFLAEAMEGYEGMQDKDWKTTLAAVRRQVAEAGSEAKVIPMHRSRSKWWRAAAAVLVIGSGAMLTFILTKNKPEERSGPEIAQTITTSPDSNTAKNDLIAPVQTESTRTGTPSAKEKISSANGTIAQVDPQAGKTDGNAVAKQQVAAVADTTKADNVTFANAVNTTSSAPSAINTPLPVNNNGVLAEQTTNDKKAFEKNNDVFFKKQSAPVQNRKEQSVNNFFNAQVVTTDNSPLPFTNISIRSEGFGTYADVKGNFRLVSADTALNVEVRSVGYKPRTFLLKSNQPVNKIVLLEDETALSEKTVIQSKDIGKNKRSHRATLLIDSVINVEPADGWDNYNTYVANNFDIPEETLKNEFHGEVELSFDVKSNGSITNIRIDKSPGAAYEEAAKRLIEQGPQWKVKKGRRSKVSVKVKF